MWPRFVRNTSDRFEARFSPVEVTQSPSLLLQGMVGSQMPIAVSHGEGRVEVRDAAHLAALESKGLVALRYVDNFGKVTETYPANPNGSPNGITAVTTESGRVTIMMPHLNVFSVLSATPRIRKTGARMAHGCAFSAMHVSSWGKSSAHWFCSPDEAFTPHPALNTNRYYKLPTQGAFCVCKSRQWVVCCVAFGDI